MLHETQTIKGFRLSPHQKRLWLLQQNSSAYLTQCSILIEGNLQLEVLKAGIDKIVNRHEILRTSFSRLPGVKFPIMVVLNSSSTSWRDIDLSDFPALEQSSKIEDIFQEMRHQNFDLEYDSILQFYLLKLSIRKYILLVYLPAICADILTIKNLFNEIGNSYFNFQQDEELDDKTVQFLQFSEWQNQLIANEDAEAANEYWLKQKLSRLADLKLPFENKSLKQSRFEINSFQLAIAPELTAKIETLAYKYETSANVVLLACWQTLIWRLTGQPEIIIGMGCDRREYEEFHDILGLLATWIPIKSHLLPDLSLREVLELAEKTLDEAVEWQDYFVPEPAENDNHLAFPIGFEFEKLSEKYLSAGISFTLDKYYSCIEPFKVKLTCTQYNNTLNAELYYDINYFSIDTIQNLAKQFQTLLTSATANPDEKISKLEILSYSDRQKLLVEFNKTQVDYPQDKCIHQLFEAQVEKTPNNIAVVFEDQQLTYGELNRKANQLAHYLQQQGVKPEIIVGLCVERSLEMIIGLLGILKAGGAYLPLDPTLPQEALALRLQDAQVSLVISHTPQQVPSASTSLVNSLRQMTNDKGQMKVICLGEDWDTIAQYGDESPTTETTPENLVYILYTSGSTGKPKGVTIEHRQLINYIYAILEKLDLQTGANFATVSSFAADLGNTAIFPSLCNGGCLHVVSQERVCDPAALAAYFDLHPIDCLKIVPSHLASFLVSTYSEKILPHQCLILGGETFSWHLLAQIQQYSPTCRIFNHYGPTESTVGVLSYLVESGQANHDSETVPLGRPLSNTQVYVLDQQMQPVSIGMPGELYIGGAGLARGYLNSSELTTTKFIPNPFNNAPKEKLYKTGDRVRYLPDGNLEFLGRIDSQVKIRGFRIELGEIESALKQHPKIQEVVVLAREDEPGNQRLVAYVVMNQGQTSNTSELRLFLQNKLPEYMMPSAFVVLKKLPLNPNGKVDRLALPSPDTARPDLEDTFVAPRTPVEKLLAQIWSEVLRLERVGVHDNFFDLGGHSLLATQVVSRLRNAFEVDLAVRDLFETPTIADLAVIIAQRLAQATDSELLAQAFAEIEQLSQEEVQAILGEQQLMNWEESRK
ncbi:amino acid adenylation domain-containing protein (plasmid) [Nostoc sp. UHCC 0926]|uniref:non-ribosomal peptide synthetase n=1 Tax=Nostoc sp. UHCC 0926 TaxID=3025190 RepID=UPI00236161B4|nr:amino acid adenylation domain-containing protein [Nostoc sp. UHCC 0926]WDD36586.1 amino acid adenylation domain-containing protein [Nostoc sp. UHCC 0926]